MNTLLALLLQQFLDAKQERIRHWFLAIRVFGFGLGPGFDLLLNGEVGQTAILQALFTGSGSGIWLM